MDQLPDINGDDNLDLPDVGGSGSDPEPVSEPSASRPAADLREKTGGHANGNGHGRGDGPSMGTTSCPFAALSMALDGNEGNEGMFQKIPSAGPSGKIPMMKHDLPTIDQFTPSSFDDEEEEDEENGIPVTCPMTGNPSRIIPKLGRRGSLTQSVGSSSASASKASKAGKSFAPSSRSSRRSGSRSSASKGKFEQSKSRRQRRVGKKCKPPPYDEADVKKYAPMIRSSWNRVIELKGYFELGGLYYDTLFSMAPELQNLFTLERNEMGVKFVDMLASMVAVVDCPPKLHEKLEDLSPMHIRKGVQAAYMPQMGAVLFAVLQQGLAAEFTPQCKDAWGWVWTWLSKSMALTLAGAGQHSSLVIMSWDMALDNTNEEELGGMVFDTLIRTAPNFKSIFSRPRQVMAMKFIDMISTIVSFADDPERMKEQVRWLGVRHVKYGAKPHHTQILGQVLITVLEEAVGEEWSSEMEKAWLDLWNTACAAMMEAIKDAEQHGTVVEEVWTNVKKKSTPHSLGGTVVTRLLKADSSMVARFSSDWLDAAEERRREGSSGEAKGGAGAGSGVEIAISDDNVDNGLATLSGSSSKRPPFTRRVKASIAKLRRTNSATSDAGPRGAGVEHRHKQQRLFDRAQAEEAFGQEVWGFLETVMTLLWEPEQMNEKLIVTGTRFFKYGMRLCHLDPLGEAVHEALRIALACPCNECGKDEWKSHISDAWAWLWGTVCHSLSSTIESAEADHPKIALESWELIKAAHTTEEIGDVLFGELTREAPHVVHLFKRPKKLQSFMFIQAIETLCLFASRPADFFDDLRSFTIRHIKYGVKSEYVKPFGKAVMQGLEELAGDNWTNDIRSAWYSVWMRLSACVARSLNVGTNLITVSLVNGDLLKMQEAAECAPRGERIAWLTKVEVNGTVMSPLYWAIRDGKFKIAQFMIQDLLTIRADRECYYYGREQLTASHPDLVKVLCNDSPELVTDFLDGLMWHSQSVLDGRLRVNYYIKDLYADPEQMTDAWKSPLAIFALEGKPEMFMHPVLNKLLELKWQRFGVYMFVGVQLWFVLLIALFTTGFLQYGCHCSSTMIAIRLATGALSALAFLFMSLIILRQVGLGQTGVVHVLWVRLHVPRLLLNKWNLLRYACMITTSISAFTEGCWLDADTDTDTDTATRSQTETQQRKAHCERTAARRAELEMMGEDEGGGLFGVRGMGSEGGGDGASWDMVLLALSALLLWAQLLQVLTVSSQLGTLSFAIGRLLKQVVRNLVIVLILIIAFACALNALGDPGNLDVEVAVVNVVRVTLGLDSDRLVLMHNSALAFMVVFVMLVHLGMFSILIAQLVKGYDELFADQEGNSRMNRAFQCVEMESFLSVGRRKRYYDECAFDKSVEFDNGDEGPTGAIQCFELANIRAGSHYVADRIMRCTGTASALDPWPATQLEDEDAKN